MDASSYMMKTEGGDNKIEETEDLEWLEEKAITAEQSQEHTRGTKPDKNDQYEQDTSQKPLLDLKNLQFFLEDRDYYSYKIN